MANINIVCLKGISVGAIVDIVGSTAMMFLLAMVVAMGTPTPVGGDRALAVMDALRAPEYQLTAVLLGSLFSVVGGYVAARIAKRGEVLNGGLSALPCVLLGVSMMFDPQDPFTVWQHLTFFVLSPSLGALGGYLRLRRAAVRVDHA